ncbi:ubiquinol oxidase 2, mitochondrial isoform X2 [Cryptomeria japonica]|uniref:ubiquinol oxidase 2, mitochondrial isoform X2 n=1 Tax=Cryptomeria japonica TaxID=3369 RepID=UPI0025ABBE16|nr:ubiquinol oxidase 2, mitochondrial isoform X2 [Cryptomeria japonica]
MYSRISRSVVIRRQNYGILSAHFKAYKSTGASQAQGTGNELQEPHIGAKIQPREDIQPPQPIEQANGKDNKLVYSSYWGIPPTGIKREDGSPWPWKCFKRRFGCRAMMLETVAAVPGMVGGMLLHLKSLRKFEHSGGWVKALLEEAENERMHLMTMVEVVKPKWYERALVLTVQGVFFNAFFLLYLASPKLAHRVVGYLEEEAIHSYTEFLKDLDNGHIENVPAPAIAIDYWRLSKDATLRDVVIVIRADEAHHRDVNHFASDIHFQGKQLRDAPAPVGYH